MKFFEISSFKREIERSFPHDIRDLYFLIVEDAFERKKIIENIICYLPKKSTFSIVKLSEKHTLQEILTEIETFSIFDEKKIVVVDRLELFKKSEIQLIVKHLNKMGSSSFLILACGDKRDLLTLENSVNKRGIILDLSEEKPWDRKKRISTLITSQAAQAKKSIKEDAKKLFIKIVGLDFASLENELFKLIAYVGDKEVIEIGDVEEVTTSSKYKNSWKVAKDIVWGETFSEDLEILDSSSFVLLLAAIRYNLQEGLLLLDGGGYKKRAAKAKALGKSFFIRGLVNLFEIEYLFKSSSINSKVLLDIFINRLQKDKRCL